MQEKWRRRIRWFLDCFTPSYTMYSKSGCEIRINSNGGWTTRKSDWPKRLRIHLAERARLEALWRAEQEAAEKKQAGETNQK